MKRTNWILVLGLSVVGFGNLLLSLPTHPAQAQSQTSLASVPAPNVAPIPADPLMALSDRFEQVAHKLLPAVVAVEAIKPPKNAASKKPQEESGSGILIHLDQPKSGYFVLTNNHVISGARNDQITLHLADGRIYRPTQTWTDPETDIALMQIDGAGLPTASLGNSDTAKVGRWVIAIGSPFGLNQTVTHGIISARDRGQVSLGGTIRIKEFLQTDAAINPGSSGGPLIDLAGDVIGINTAIASHSGSNSGVAFSIPINLVRRTMSQMLTTGSVSRGYLGMQLSQNYEPNDALRMGLTRLTGALVEKVYPETPAANSGLRVNDVILSVESVEIRNENHLINLISNLPIGQKIRMQVWRDRTTTTLEATVGDWSKAQSKLSQPVAPTP